jgi:ABC-type dipeptide/oligopeptide/nickel transport system ATPase subunit
MSIKIKNIKITGIRGARNTVELPLVGKSIAIYGDNGTGKSSISDGVEWFLTDKVSHLSGNSEIDLKEALRNSHLAIDDVSEVAISFTTPALDCSKTLVSKKAKLVSEVLNTTPDFKAYIADSEKENLLLRYQFLTDFIDNTKGEKLKYLSDIIGFSEVTKKKEVLLKSYNSIRTEIKNQNFESQISTQKHILIEKIGAAISQEKNLLEKLNETIAPLNTGLEIKKFSDIDVVLEAIKKPLNNKILEELKFLEDTNNALTNLKNEISLYDAEYEKYFVEFEKLSNDVNAIMQTFLSDLLKAGSAVLSKKYYKDNNCPLCLQEKDIAQLQIEIKQRLEEVEQSLKMKDAFDKAKESIFTISSGRVNKMENFLTNIDLNKDENALIKTAVSEIKEKISKYQQATTIKVTSGEKIPQATDLKLLESDFNVQDGIAERILAIKESVKNDNATVIYSNISASKDAFINIQKFEKQKEKLEVQRKTLEIIYNEFVKKQKLGLEDFIAQFSGTINEFYQYMNPDEPFQEIRIITIGEDDELNGITIEYKYNGNWVSPPQKYFSESHLNCFGISFFLASVKAFNLTNKFIVLDDVISSFDQTHRKRFAELIFEKFSDYQVVLLTHEKDWFMNIVTPLAKKNGWLINKIKWTENKGTHLNEKPTELKEQIIFHLAEAEIENLGNPMRRYLEHVLKEVALNLEAKLSFKFNDQNEHRMPYELLMGIRSEIKKNSKDLALKFPVLDRIENSALFGNVLSHDNPMNAALGDLKAFWADILEMEAIFNCQESLCKRPKVSLVNYITVAKEIGCGCGVTKYDWKRA